MEKELKYEELTSDQLEQCERSLIALYEHMATDGDEMDAENYHEIEKSHKARIDRLMYCRFFLNSDGYVEISL